MLKEERAITHSGSGRNSDHDDLLVYNPNQQQFREDSLKLLKHLTEMGHRSGKKTHYNILGQSLIFG